jgi:alkanesulfonate monooxygenase SsuD/methylene tetrahydromethanopterin reductase-like flavin-dependent oxidoreductase (luciferase family)
MLRPTQRELGQRGLGQRGLGISAGLDPGLARELAMECERLGYHSLWTNDEPTSPGLPTLAHFASAAPQLELGIGALPVDRHRPAQIVAEIGRLGLDPGKLWIGIGAGQLRSPIKIIEQAVAELRELVPEQTRVVVAAMRPQLCRFGGAIADGVLLNWMPPGPAAQARKWVHEGAHSARRITPVVASYVRVAFGPGASQRLRDEEDRYRHKNEGHRRHFEAVHVPPGSVGVAGATQSEVLAGLESYHDVLDLAIARILPACDADLLRVAAVAAAP